MPLNRNFHVRDLLGLDKAAIWGLPDGGLNLTFDNGETHKVPTRATVMSVYYWRMFVEWEGAQITTDHHLMFDPYKKSTHVKMAGRVMWDVFFGRFEHYLCGEANDQLWEMTLRIQQISNEIYNDCLCMLGQHIVGLDIEDIVEILADPVILETKQEFRDGKKGVDRTHNEVFDRIVNPGSPLKDNVVALGMSSGGLDQRQANQSVAMRAYVPDINGESSVHAIEDGYADGIGKLYDQFRETRAASISLYMQSGPLEQSEYNNRMCQFLCGIITGIHYGDCGGEHTVPWKVTPTCLPALRGKVMMVDGENVVIMGSETHLIGETINVRSITTCSHGDPTTPCSVCVGMNAITTPPGTNYGHHISTEPLARISQTILSTKHVLASTKSVYLDVDENNAKYLALSEDNPFHVHLKKTVLEGNFAIRLPKEEVACINDILSTDDVYMLSPERVTGLTTVQIIEYSKEGMVRGINDVRVDVGGKESPLTNEFLDYMAITGWEVIGQSLEVPLKDWDYTQPFICTPRRGEDIMSVLRLTTQFLKSPNDVGAIRAVDYKHPGPAIAALLGILQSKISGVNFCHAEVFVRALMASGEESYALPRGGEPFRFIRLKEAIQKRGLGAALAFEGIQGLVYSPSTYMRHQDNLPGHPLDWLVS